MKRFASAAASYLAAVSTALARTQSRALFFAGYGLSTSVLILLGAGRRAGLF